MSVVFESRKPNPEYVSPNKAAEGIFLCIKNCIVDFVENCYSLPPSDVRRWLQSRTPAEDRSPCLGGFDKPVCLDQCRTRTQNSRQNQAGLPERILAISLYCCADWEHQILFACPTALWSILWRRQWYLEQLQKQSTHRYWAYKDFLHSDRYFSVSTILTANSTNCFHWINLLLRVYHRVWKVKSFIMHVEEVNHWH